MLLFSDRVRTSINVLGDGFAAGVVAHILQVRTIGRDAEFTLTLCAPSLRSMASFIFQKRLDVSDARNDFRTEIKEEIG